MEGKETAESLAEEAAASSLTRTCHLYVVDQQPIGQLLFELWCEQKGPAYHRCLKFLDAARRYEVGFALPACSALTNGHKDLFAPCVDAVKRTLAGAPFKQFTGSMYFHRYLQWKWLEAQPVTYKTFRIESRKKE
ncbi:unnamed protein product [Phaedon cochleariae]|uniref:RGS domain-containing protein n=1 Tax=Phaedon cochleariae TaxID=80249 RepID=A0A9N9SDV3_PHACE|nr:unnamed protein product [Phaedon cochleariae]